MAKRCSFRLSAFGNWRSALGRLFKRSVSLQSQETSGADAPGSPSDNASFQIAGSQTNWLRVLSAQELLQVVQAEHALREIWRKSRLSRPAFERDCLAAVHRYAEFVQLLPASEAHHHAHVGGLLTHTLEMLLAAMSWRNAHLLPENSPIEVIDAQRDEWTLVVFHAALLHDIGKVLTDLRITWRGKDMDAVRWVPLAGALNDLAQGWTQAEYLVQFAPKVDRDYSGHSRTAMLLLQRIASPAALAILARQPQAFDALHHYLGGADTDSLLARIVRQADMASARHSLALGSRARFATSQAVPLVDLLMMSMKSMLRAGTVLPLNRSGAAGWVHEGAIWFVAKRLADAVREWIKKHEPEAGIPGEAKNDRLFDTWQEHGCILPNPHTGQAVWYVTVHGHALPDAEVALDTGAAEDDARMAEQECPNPGAYSHSLTMLRFPLERLYEDPGQHPPAMHGTIEVHAKRYAAAASGAEHATAVAAKNAQRPAGPVAAGPEEAGEAAALQATPSADPGHRAAETDALAGRSKLPQASKPGKPALKAPSFNRPRSAPSHAGRAVSEAACATGGTGEAAPEACGREAAAGLKPLATPLQDLPVAPIFAADPEADFPLKADGTRCEEAAWSGLVEAPVSSARSTSDGDKPANESEGAEAAPPGPVDAVRSEALNIHEGAEPNRSTPHELPTASASAASDLVNSAFLKTQAPESPAPPRSPFAHATPIDRVFSPVLLEPKLPRRPGFSGEEGAAAHASTRAISFISWVQAGLADRSLRYNETGAAVHFVPEGMALVSPLIFKLFASTRVDESQLQAESMRVQREVVKAGWHQAGPNRTNILRYAVIGRSGTEAAKLAAVVLMEPGRFVQPVPPSNPALKLL